MRKVERPAAAPASLSGVASTNEQTEAAAYYAGWVPGQPAYGAFKAYKGADVVLTLRTLFHGKCAYCEGAIEKGSAEVEHYRPKGGVINEDDHPGYWWLAHTWTNLLPSCGACNKALNQHVVTTDMTLEDVEALQATPMSSLVGKANQFPIGAATRLSPPDDDHAAEQPHIVDPTRADPDDFIAWRHDGPYSLATAKPDAMGSDNVGRVTIECLALNRLGLSAARTKHLKVLKAQRIRLFERLEAAQGAGPDAFGPNVAAALATVDDMRLRSAPDQEYSAMTAAFVAELEAELRAWLVVHAPHLAPT